MENLPGYIGIVFGLTTCLTLLFFYQASRYALFPIAILLLWLVLQSILALYGFYTVTDSIPPRFLLLILPPLVMIAVFFLTVRGRSFMDQLDPGMLTLLHICRIPVELVLFWLFLNKAVPKAMTFEGRNFDILSGLTAPVIYYFGFVKQRIGKRSQLVWNLLCMGLLINIVAMAILSAPSPFRQFTAAQPNTAILYFPFIWLPCCIVPLVLLAHLATIRHLLKN